MDFLSWGLLPTWYKQEEKGDHVGFINARVESVNSKPSFKTAFKKRRCIIIANGFYEWKTIGRIKQPFCIRQSEQPLIGFAGIWDEANTNLQKTYASCAILTQAASEAIIAIHPRMPVILEPKDYEAWLNPHSKSIIIEKILENSLKNNLYSLPVSTKVNNPAFDTKACIEPLN